MVSRLSRRRHFVPNPVQRNYSRRVGTGRRRPLSIHTGYDGLQRLLALNRGTLDGAPSLSNLSLQQAWNLDATGNWGQFTNLDLVTPGNSLVQQRASNRANEIAALGMTVNAPWAVPRYDRNGNMTSIPSPLAPTTAIPATFDAWNRLATYANTSVVNPTQYVYDGLHRRGLAEINDSTPRFFVNSQDWQVLENDKGVRTIYSGKQF